MPYRRAHWWLLALLPTIAIAFWPGYFGRLRTAPFALHAHGITATVWVILTMVQSWSVATRRLALHRSTGWAVFVVAPLFAAAGANAVIDMSRLYAANSDPFNGTYGAWLALEDTIAVAAFVALIIGALLTRRRARTHGGYMLATILLVLPPIIARLFQHVPGFGAVAAASGLSPFDFAFYVSMLLATGIALWLARADWRAGRGFAIVAGMNLLQVALYPTFARSAAWEQATRRVAATPAAPVALSAAVATLALMVWAWRTVPARPAVARRPAVA